MKKTLIFVFVLLAALSVFALDGLTFEIVNQTPLFREPVADPYSFNSHVYLVAEPKTNSSYSFRTLVAENPIVRDLDDNVVPQDYGYTYIDLPYKNGNSNLLVNMKLAGNVNALHFTYQKENLPKLEAELNLAGSINTLFVLDGGNETLDFDGSFFVGGTVRYKDFLSVRAGIHHFSAHWGDESLEKFYEYNGIAPYEQSPVSVNNKTYYYQGLIEYVRDNSWLLGVSVDLPENFRFCSEIEIPKNPSWLRPFIHTPAYYKNSGDDRNNNTGSYRTAHVEGCFDDAEIKNESELKKGAGYAALRIHASAEWRHDFKNIGTLVLAADVQAHQDGMTKHQIGAFSKKNPWEFEFTAGASFEFAKVLEGKKSFSIDAFYHDGRTPATQFFYRSGSFFYLGVGIH